MFYYLNGTLALVDANLAVIDCGGVGYACHTTNYTLTKLQLGKPAKLFTYCGSCRARRRLTPWARRSSARAETCGAWKSGWM